MASEGVFVRPGEVPDGEEGQHIVSHSKPTPWRPDALEGATHGGNQDCPPAPTESPATEPTKPPAHGEAGGAEPSTKA